MTLSFSRDFIAFIVEDSESISFIYKKYLELCGCKEILTAKNGKEAVSKYKELQTKPDIILMDHRMPGKDGIQTTKEILKLDKNAKIIFTSGDDTIEKEALLSGAIEFLKKPFEFKKLMKKIQKNLF